MKALDYIPSFIASLAVAMGIFPADKWDSTQNGLHQLTPLGWTTVGLGAAALFAALLLTWLRHRELDLQSRQYQHIKAIAHAEVRLALRQITWPFFSLFGDSSEESYLELVPPHVEDRDTLASVMRIELRSKDPGLSRATHDVTWAEFLKLNADLGAARIDRALQIYVTYLGPLILEALSELRTSEFLYRLQSLDETVEVNTAVEFLEFPFPGGSYGENSPPAHGYRQFWTMLRRVDKLLVKDPARLRRRL